MLARWSNIGGDWSVSRPSRGRGRMEDGEETTAGNDDEPPDAEEVLERGTRPPAPLSAGPPRVVPHTLHQQRHTYGVAHCPSSDPPIDPDDLHDGR
jgi:hypothetical protein